MESFDIIFGMTFLVVIVFSITLMYILWSISKLESEQVEIEEKLKRIKKLVKKPKKSKKRKP